MPSSSFVKDKLRRHILGTASWTKPAAVYCALFTDLGEVAAASYARVQRNPSDANWTFPAAPNDGEASNTADIQFPVPAESWGVVTTAKIFDAAVAGNELGSGSLTNPKTVNAGDPAPKYPAGTFKVLVK